MHAPPPVHGRETVRAGGRRLHSSSVHACIQLASPRRTTPSLHRLPCLVSQACIVSPAAVMQHAVPPTSYLATRRHPPSNSPLTPLPPLPPPPRSSWATTSCLRALTGRWRWWSTPGGRRQGPPSMCGTRVRGVGVLSTCQGRSRSAAPACVHACMAGSAAAAVGMLRQAGARAGSGQHSRCAVVNLGLGGRAPPDGA